MAVSSASDLRIDWNMELCVASINVKKRTQRDRNSRPGRGLGFTGWRFSGGIVEDVVLESVENSIEEPS
jgi:hypothetical protein